MTGRAIPVLLGLLLLTTAQAVEPNPRASPVLELDAPVTALAVATNSGHIVAGMADPSTSFGQPSDVNVWRAWDASGNQLRNEDADRANCNPSLLAGDNCIGHVVAIAVSADGTRIAVAARGADDTSGRLVLATMQGNIFSRTEYTDESPTSLALSGDGTKLAVGLRVPATTGEDTGRVRSYAWTGSGAGTVSQSWSTVTDFAVTDVAISSDGRVSAAAADRHYRFSLTGSPFEHDSDAPFLSVAMARNGPNHWSVAGASDGGVLLYSDAQDQASASAALDIPPGTAAQRAVAMVGDATMFAAGDANGVVRLFRNPDLVSGGAQVAATPALHGAVAGLEFSHDGRYLAVAAGNGTYLYQVSPTGLSQLWASVGTAPVTHVGITSDGESVASASGKIVTVFTALHRATASVPGALSTDPGDELAIPVTLRNTGNRDETISLSRALPQDWLGTLSRSTVTLAPDATAIVYLNVTPPQFASPGEAIVTMTHFVQGIPTATGIPVTVNTLRQWTLQPEGALSRDIEAGGTVRFPIRLNNLGNGIDTTTIAVAADMPGWTATVAPSSVTVPRGQTGTAEVTVTAPETAGQLDSARITVTLGADGDAGLQLTATVGARFGASLLVADPQSTGTRGEASLILLRVTNTGNIADTFTITPGPVPTGWLVSVDSSALASPLGPGQSRDVGVTVTPAAGSDAGNYQVTFQVASQGDASKSASATHTLTLEGEAATTTTTKSKGSPAPGVPLLALGLAALVALARRRGPR